MSNEQQARLDAEADAATVWRNRGLFGLPLDAESTCALALYSAVLGYHDDLKGRVMAAARVAFNAVPALRGDK